MIKIGIVGCGAIGKEICRAVDKGIIKVQLVAIADRKLQAASAFASSLRSPPEVMSAAALIDVVDLVVECASQTAVREIVPSALKKGKDVMIMSVGALTSLELLKEITLLARKYGCKVYLPSGAIVGLDGLKSASIGKIDSVTLTTRKPLSSLERAPYIEQCKVDLSTIKESTLIFEGNAEEAVKGFPDNVNVAATLSLAGIGTQNTKIRIIADPKLERNVHEICVKGNFGKFETRVENVPSTANPKTSYLAALSAIATLRRLSDPLQIGT
ncbi:MAG: aspartate dehydrogenase [Methanocellales archaeon]|nr:aspartate dehydrogenase [Methanocellales archaeon]MDD4897881.1 aspartate dehydrogenase [Methanocellales archaeon]MDD5446447.1 aspartate dehydrogenase [Methanocellales archaeon]